MEENSIRYIRKKLLIICFLLLNFTFEVMVASSPYRVIFQTFELSDDGETVQCYGQCEKSSKTDLVEKVKVTRCAGRKINVACKPGYLIKVTIATAGKLSPDLDICNYNHKKRMECAMDVTSNIQQICKGGHRCTIDVTSLKHKCGDYHLVLDIRYLCETRPTTKVHTTLSATDTRLISTHGKSTKVVRVTTRDMTTRKTVPTTKITIPTKAIRTAKLTSKKVDSTVQASTVGFNTLTSRKTTPTKYDISTKIHKLIPAQSGQSNNEFWIVFAYSAIMDSDYLKRNKTHLALVLLLSMFLGMVLCLCICLDYCRRTRKKRDTNINWNEVEITDSQIEEYNERIELINSKMVDDASKEPLCHVVLNNDHNEHCDEEEGDVYVNMSVTTPFINKNMVPDQKHFFPPRSHSKHPNDTLVESALPSLNALSPTKEYDGDNSNATIVVPSGVLPVRCSANTKKGTRRAIPQEKYNSEMSEIEEVYVEEGDLDDDRIDCCEYEYVEVEEYHACDGCSSNTQPSMAYHDTDNYLVPSKAKFASLNRRGKTNDETSNDEPTVRTLDSKRMRRSNQKDRGLQKSKSLEEPKMKSYDMNTANPLKGNTHVARQPKRGRVHVMPRCQESPSTHTCAQKSTHSDNEVSRRRRQCEMEQHRTCHQHDISLNDLYCTKCGKTEVSHLKCGSSLTSNCQSSHDEYSTDHGPLLSISNELIKNKQFCVEESGYQSHDTGTDSLCSSSFSTDHEDSRVFLPSSGHHCSCRTRPLHHRNHGSKRGPKLIIVPDQNKSINKTRRLRRDDYVKCDNQASVDVHSYDSSMDESSSRDSVRVFRRIRKQNMADDEENKSRNCSCNCGMKPTEGRIDGIETS